MEKRNLLLVFFIFTSLIYCNAQKKPAATLGKLTFTRYNNPTSIFHMKEGRRLTLNLVTDTGSIFKYTGQVYAGDTMTFYVLGGTKEFQGFTDGGATFEQRFTTLSDSELTIVPKEEIDYVSVTPRFRKVFGVLGGLSLAAVFISFPLADVGYSTPTFNSVTILEGSAISLAVNSIFYKIFKERRFRVKGGAVHNKQ